MENFDYILENYESANNSHDWKNVEPLVHPEATYFFTDGTFTGIDEIEKAVLETFKRIQDETYSVSNIKWIFINEDTAACSYNFNWRGVVDGKDAEGSGRGTNVWKKTDGVWQVLHEHLSK